MDDRHRGTRVRAVAMIATALVLIAGAIEFARLHRAAATQRVHVRYMPATSESDRSEVEKQFGLAAGIQRGDRTWSYVLQDRSHQTVQRLLSNPLVEDTHHIDRPSFRVGLDRPDLPANLRTLAEDGWLAWLATLLVCGAIVALWSVRRELVNAAGWLAVDGARLVTTLRAPPTPTISRRLLVGVAVVTAGAVPLGVDGRPDEAAFVHLYEATSILAGDLPYLDFFEWGAPLPALLSAVAQWVVGYRVIGELLLQWAFIVAGVTVSFRLGLRQARSTLSVLAVLPLALLVVTRAGHHFSKWFCIPVGLWFAWRYIDAPSAGRSATLGFFTVVAFLFRHDYGLWVGLSAVLAVLLAPVAKSENRSMRSLAVHGFAYASTMALALLPWAVLVSSAEGLPSYVAASAERFGFERSAGNTNPYGALLQVNPVQQLRAVALPTPKPGVVSFEWAPVVDDGRKGELERRHHLRPLTDLATSHRVYQLPNVYDPSLLALKGEIERDSGIDWELLDRASRRVPSREGSDKWLAQMTMLVPLALIVSGAAEAVRGWLWGEVVGVGGVQRFLAGVVLACVNETLLREWAYFLVVAPVTAALSARFLAMGTELPGHRLVPRPTRVRQVLDVFRVALATVLLVVTTYAATVWNPPLLAESVSETVRLVRISVEEWTEASPSGRNPLNVYLRDCTIPGDRLLITGSTPYYVPYFTNRPMAGGHLDWSIGLRADSKHEALSLELLKRQSVPFVVGRGRNVIDEFRYYPRIRAHLAAHYRAVDGSGGSLLYDGRRQVVRSFGPDGLPCFR